MITEITLQRLVAMEEFISNELFTKFHSTIDGRVYLVTSLFLLILASMLIQNVNM